MDVRGTKPKLIETIQSSAAPDAVKGYLIWSLESRSCEGFCLDSHGLSAHDGEIIEHTHIKKIM